VSITERVRGTNTSAIELWHILSTQFEDFLNAIGFLGVNPHLRGNFTFSQWEDYAHSAPVNLRISSEYYAESWEDMSAHTDELISQLRGRDEGYQSEVTESPEGSQSPEP
jgi:hypothetical protein